MAVSYALRGTAHVAVATRARILEVAERLGYRPDPVLTHFMDYVRTRRVRRNQANLGVLMLGGESNYAQRLIAGVQQRAEEIGYSIDRIDVAAHGSNAAALTRILEARGIAGLLLPPCKVPQSFDTLLDWDRFSVVAMSHSIQSPRFHRVVPHHFHNAMLALRQLRERGFKRPVFALALNLELRTNHAYTGAMAWSALDAREPMLPPFPASDGLDRMRAWIQRHRPDAIIMSGVSSAEQVDQLNLGARTLKKLGVIVMDHRPGYRRAGINQKTLLLGATAVDLLVARLHLSERGVPRDAVVCMVEGSWVDGIITESPG